MRFIISIYRRLNAKSNSYAQISLSIEMFFDDVNHSWVFRVIELSRHHNH